MKNGYQPVNNGSIDWQKPPTTGSNAVKLTNLKLENIKLEYKLDRTLVLLKEIVRFTTFNNSDEDYLIEQIDKLLDINCTGGFKNED